VTLEGASRRTTSTVHLTAGTVFTTSDPLGDEVSAEEKGIFSAHLQLQQKIKEITSEVKEMKTQVKEARKAQGGSGSGKATTVEFSTLLSSMQVDGTVPQIRKSACPVQTCKD
jgi:alpha-D-ribose 1-methylphosphonate 5-triphosphate synthase subunit PhnG